MTKPSDPSAAHPTDDWAAPHWDDDSPLCDFIRHLYSDERDPIRVYSPETLDEFASCVSALRGTPAYADSGVLAQVAERIEEELMRRFDETGTLREGFNSVNDSKTLSHEMVDAACREQDAASMVTYADEAERVGATGLAADLRAWADRIVQHEAELEAIRERSLKSETDSERTERERLERLVDCPLCGDPIDYCQGHGPDEDEEDDRLDRTFLDEPLETETGYVITEDDDGVWLRENATGELCGPYGDRAEALADRRDELRGERSEAPGAETDGDERTLCEARRYQTTDAARTIATEILTDLLVPTGRSLDMLKTTGLYRVVRSRMGLFRPAELEGNATDDAVSAGIVDAINRFWKLGEYAVEEPTEGNLPAGW